MPDQCRDTPRCDGSQQTMSIHTRKITDSCRDKDCIEDLRVYLTAGSQELLDTAANVRVRSAELIHTDIDVEPVAFDRNHYCIDITFYYRVLADALVGSCRPTTLYGLGVFNKRAVLCGEDSRAHFPQRYPDRPVRRLRHKPRQPAYRRGGGTGSHGAGVEDQGGLRLRRGPGDRPDPRSHPGRL